MEREPDLKPVYIYIVPKSKWPKKVKTCDWSYPEDGKIFSDYDPNTGRILGLEILSAHSVEIDGREV